MTESMILPSSALAGADADADEEAFAIDVEAGAEDIAMLTKVLAEGSRDWLRGYNLVHQAILRVLELRPWEHRSRPDGTRFASFAEFACHPQPEGLGVTTRAAAAILGKLLRTEKKYREWAEILQRIATEPGRPRKKKTLADGEGLNRFYSISTSSGAVDRTLYRMITEREANLRVAAVFEELCNGELTPAAAASNLRWGARQKPAAKLERDFLKLRPEARVKALVGLFGKLEEQERAALLEALRAVERRDAEFVHERPPEEKPIT